MPRLSLLVLLLSPALLKAQRGCPCPDSVSLFLQLDESYRARKFEGGPWDVWPEGTFPDIRIKLKPSTKNYDCGPEGCDTLCPGYFKTIELPRLTDKKASITVNLPGQQPLQLPGCNYNGSTCQEVSTAIGFENVTLPNEPFHFFALDEDLLLHDLIFEHAKDEFRSKEASEHFEHVSSEPLCQMTSPNPANPYVSDCVLTIKGRRVGLVRIIKDPQSLLSYRKAPLKEPLEKIRKGLREDFGKWDYAYDAQARVLIGTDRYQPFFDNYEKAFREEQKAAAEPCDVRDLYRIALKYSVKAGPLGFYDPNVGAGWRTLEALGDSVVGVYSGLEGLAALIYEGVLPDNAADAEAQLAVGKRALAEGLDKLIEQDYAALLRKVSTADETLELLNGLDSQLGGALAESWDYKTLVARTRVQDLKTVVATNLMQQWRQSDIRGRAVSGRIAVLKDMVANPGKYGKIGKVVKGAGIAGTVLMIVQSALPPAFFSQEYQERRLKFLETIRGVTAFQMGDMGFRQSSAWGDVLKDFQGGLNATTVEERCLALQKIPATVCAGLSALQVDAPVGAPVAPDPFSPGSPDVNKSDSERKAPESIEKQIANCVARGLPLGLCRELQGLKP
jgi:hypothetical protein